jgi:hypothetical protein
MNKHAEFVSSLRELADWYEARPDLKVPNHTSIGTFVFGQDEFREMTKIAGNVTKSHKYGFLEIGKTFGSIHWYLNIEQELVCERVEVGVKSYPAVPARTVPVYEWKCPKSFLGKK